jgi:hypothetical protein
MAVLAVVAVVIVLVQAVVGLLDKVMLVVTVLPMQLAAAVAQVP